MASPPYRVSLVIFDVDGTLVDWEHSYAVALRAASQELASRLGHPIAPAALRQARDLVAAEPAWARRNLREIRAESFRRVLVAAGAFESRTHEAALTAYFGARDAALRAFDDVTPVLAELAGNGFNLVAATNGNAALQRLPLSRHLDSIHQAEGVGVSKPDPAFFARVIERVGGNASEAISVGDSIANDIEPPQSLGMHALLLDRTGHAGDSAYPRIESLAELPRLLELAPG